MSPEQEQFLKLPNKQGILLSEEAAWLIGVKVHNIPVLIRAKLLRPLGRPGPSSIKYCATVEVDRLIADVAWLARVIDAIYRHWRNKNAKKRKKSARTRRKKFSGIEPHPTTGGEEAMPEGELGA